jgi:outer membrane protein OmpA-like peptidoglycan-associated protein
MVQTLTTAQGDRESVHRVTGTTTNGLRWTWDLVEVKQNGDTAKQNFHYAELHADIGDAIRLRAYHEVGEAEEHPGYTMHSVSRAVFRRLRAAGSDSFQVLSVEALGGGGMFAGMGRRSTPVRWSGRLSVVSPSPVPFPVLLNGRRVEVPALHLKGRLTARGKRWQPELWILADSAYPMLLKWIGGHAAGGNVLQTIRLDFRLDLPALERSLSTDCRAELPGVYFGFNSAVLDAASDRTIAEVAALLAKHPDWSVTLEGHTDSIGSAAANRTLSERRVEAVRARLVSQHRVDESRLRTSGLGSARPREPNTTIEGRARNRRVELVRQCPPR